jgi:hypothetical protein
MKQKASRHRESERGRGREREKKKERKKKTYIYQAEGQQLYESPASAELARICTPASQS